MKRLHYSFSNDLVNLTLLTIFNLFARLILLAKLPAFFDEKAFYLDGARSYLTGFTDPNFEHPPLSKEIIATGIKIFGDNPWGWRLPSVLFGTLGIIVTYLLAKKLFHSSKIALLAAFFLSFDFLWFVHSRIAVPEIFLAVFSLLAVYFFWDYYQKRRLKHLILSAVFLGLAAAVKWSAVFVLLGLVGYLILAGLKKQSRPQFLGQLAVVVLSLLIVLLVYFASYTPFLTQGHSLFQVLQRQMRILHYHTVDVKPTAFGATRPYLWLANPLHFYYHPEVASNQYVIAFANPLFFWGSFGALIWYLRALFKKWRAEVALPVILVLGLYLPWFLVSRYTFFYYLLSALPFLAIILAKGLVDLENTKGKWGWRLLRLRSAFITGNALGFFLFYPFLTALPVTIWYVSLLLGGH